MTLAAILFRLARNRLAGYAVGIGFARAAALLPVRRRLLTPDVIVFDHPRPAWAGHLLIVPRARIPSLFELATPAQAAHLLAIVRAAQTMLSERAEAAAQVTLCANGGPRQEVGQVHFHLYAEPPPAPTPTPEMDGEPLWSDAQTMVYSHRRPVSPLHLIVRPRQPLRLAADPPPTAPEVAALLAPLHRLEARYGLRQRGYTIYLSGCHPAETTGLTLQVLA